MTENQVAQAERHVREAEQHVANQLATIERLRRDREQQARLGAKAAYLLARLRKSLELSREHLRRERRERGLEP